MRVTLNDSHVMQEERLLTSLVLIIVFQSFISRNFTHDFFNLFFDELK